MGRVLTILEVSQKQNYIFSSKRLRANAERSDEIAYVTGSEFFRESARDLYDERQNLVYAGGGHTVLQFDSREQAVAFTQKVTEAAVRRFDGMEMFATSIAYDESKTAGENLTALTAALERKKRFESIRSAGQASALRRWIASKAIVRAASKNRMQACEGCRVRCRQLLTDGRIRRSLKT